ncbi:MAG TPA: SET domain-containing protein-lysine N-methyltransferase [Candidatus Nanoarchaeia archaeon]|nr:SET domain-containing protein-lysine N-methyltransferase [Candidatus Nanoarchaeia archaeon]
MYLPTHLQLADFPGKSRGVIAARPLQKGEVVCELYFDSVRPREIAVNAVQRWENDFLSNNLKTIDDYFNHSCQPTTRINWSRLTFDALRDLREGEEITWNYLTTEYDLLQDSEDFDCRCESQNCLGRIKGFRYLNRQQKQELFLYLSTFLRTMMDLA